MANFDSHIDLQGNKLKRETFEDFTGTPNVTGIDKNYLYGKNAVPYWFNGSTHTPLIYTPPAKWWVYLPIPALTFTPQNERELVFPEVLGGSYAGKKMPKTGRYRFNVYLKYHRVSVAGGVMAPNYSVDTLSVNERNQGGALEYRECDKTGYIFNDNNHPLWYALKLQAHGTARLNSGDNFKILLTINDVNYGSAIDGGYVELEYLDDFIQGSF